jgi:ABC-2 type transport system ATP-binding protein
MLAGMTAQAISVRDLHKSYGTFEAVAGIDLSVAEGEVFALLGPNGAGKTTTVEILEGHRERSSGEVSVLGHDPQRGERDFKERIGIVLQETGVEPFLTVAEVIEMYRGYYPHPRPLDEIIDVVGLHEKRDTRVIKLSGGQQRRLDVAVGLAGDPDLLFLDEPTTGFDPSARRGAWEMVHNLQSLGKTVFLTTHYMDEAQNLANRVAIIVGGKIVAEGPPGSLVASDETAATIRFSAHEDSVPVPGSGWRHSGALFEMTTNEPVKVLHEVTGWSLQEGIDLEALTVSRPSLEDVYLELTKGAEEEGAVERAKDEAAAPGASGRRSRRRHRS